LEEVLEEYAFDRLDEEPAARLEEHLLWCQACREALDRVEEEIRTIRAAFASQALDQASGGGSPESEGNARAGVAPSWDRVPGWLGRGWRDRRVVWPAVLAAACVVLLLVWPREPVPDTTPAPVALASFRGGQNVVFASAPARRPLDLTLDAAEVSDPDRCRLEVVDVSGTLRWSGPATHSGEKLLARVPSGFGAGVYWVRLYAGEAELVREFGLRLE
jgi:hypothetical protein